MPTLDALLLHSPLPDPADTLTVWRAFEALVDGGRVWALGISNVSLPQFEALWGAARIRPSIVQNSE